MVMASGGYPGSYQKGKIINGLDKAGKMKDVVVFHAGTGFSGEDVVTAGGRVLGVTATGKDVKEAKAKAYEAVQKLSFDGVQYRTDIADRAIKGGTCK